MKQPPKSNQTGKTQSKALHCRVIFSNDSRKYDKNATL